MKNVDEARSKFKFMLPYIRLAKVSKPFIVHSARYNHVLLANITNLDEKTFRATVNEHQDCLL